MIRNIISSELNNLDILNIKFNWIPNSKQIRPDEKTLTEKNKELDIIELEWNSLKDYILHTVFDKNYVYQSNKKFVLDDVICDNYKFTPSSFRYNLDHKSNHYILWLPKFTMNLNINESFILYINKILNKEIYKLLNHYNFDFAYYINPKPSIIDYFHVQVFWINLYN
jgi:hypothetical protein